MPLAHSVELGALKSQVSLDNDNFQNEFHDQEHHYLNDQKKLFGQYQTQIQLYVLWMTLQRKSGYKEM